MLCTLLISDVARACGVSADTIRHYERRGAIPPAVRGPNRYRRYADATIARVKMVRRALAIGFTIDELARLFRKRAAGAPPCREVRAMAERKLAEVDARIAEMSALRETLAATIRDWDARLERTGEGAAAMLLESLE